MQGFGVHTSMWTMSWDRAGAEKAVAAAARYKMDFIEIALLNAAAVDTAHSRALLEANDLKAVCSLGLPEPVWASRHPDRAIDYLKVAIDKTAEMGALALSGVTYGGIGERTGLPPTEVEYDNVARALAAAAKHAKSRGVLLGSLPAACNRRTASASATQPPVMAAVRVPPSAWMTSQSMVIWRSPSEGRSSTARRLRPISR